MHIRPTSETVRLITTWSSTFVMLKVILSPTSRTRDVSTTESSNSFVPEFSRTNPGRWRSRCLTLNPILRPEEDPKVVNERGDEGYGFETECWQYRGIRAAVGKGYEKDATRSHRSKWGRKSMMDSSTSISRLLFFRAVT